jgi:chromosome segregation ATPase
MKKILKMKQVVTLAGVAIVVAATILPSRAAEAKVPEAVPIARNTTVLKAESGKLLRELNGINRQIQTIRQRAMIKDKGLVALNAEILELQLKLKQQLLKKYPELVALESQKAELIKQHRATRVALDVLISGPSSNAKEQ